ncbi:MAG TPA: MBL fold metallo-hydrolase [Phycisphaerales bacterium]|nr:MBL fold metallo-hydrolase [Phycisphaerales bacterium]
MARKKLDPPVTVRMFRQGLGDCFLITVGDTQPKHILIDCGMWEATPERRRRLEECVGEIKRLTGSLDLLVVTHEHWDHVSGFSQCRAQFEKLPFKRLLMAWTEDPADAVAGEIRQKVAALRMNLRDVIRAAREARVPLAELPDSLLPINDLEPRPTRVLSAAGGLGVANSPSDAMTWLKTRAEESPECEFICARPGRVIEDIPGIRIYVLGPPRSEDELRKADGGARARRAGESYLHMDAALGLEEDLAAGAAGSIFAARGRAGGSQVSDPGLPFRRGSGSSLDELTPHDEYFRRSYGERAGPHRWRRIDSDWTSSITQLALRMDKFTNNTSLVLAIELVGSGRVLLFPGDAQFGNWNSWDSVKFEKFPQVNAEDLLRRTVLYKVGHHGSHNATLRLKGLDRMTSPDLIAMIPVDEAFARRQPHGGWKMPYPALYQDLKSRTGGRILRSDTGLPALKEVTPQLRSAFQKMVATSPLSITLKL